MEAGRGWGSFACAAHARVAARGQGKRSVAEQKNKESRLKEEFTVEEERKGRDPQIR